MGDCVCSLYSSTNTPITAVGTMVAVSTRPFCTSSDSAIGSMPGGASGSSTPAPGKLLAA